jgi:large subunit ribosomal protein L20
MVRVKRGKVAHKRRKRLLKLVKGYKWGRKKRYRLAKQALIKALTYAYAHRKRKKREMRRLWQLQLNAALREKNLKYSQFINLLKKKNIILDRKILATLAKEHPEIFDKLVEIITQ